MARGRDFGTWARPLTVYNCKPCSTPSACCNIQTHPQILLAFAQVLWRVEIGEQLTSFGDPELVGLSPAHDDGSRSGDSSGGLPYTHVCSLCHVLELDALVVATRGGAMALMHVGEGEEQPRLEQVRGAHIAHTAIGYTALRFGSCEGGTSGAKALLRTYRTEVTQPVRTGSPSSTKGRWFPASPNFAAQSRLRGAPTPVTHLLVDTLLQVGCVEGGLSALEWSPDGELLAAVSGRGSLLVMNTVRGSRGVVPRSNRRHRGPSRVGAPGAKRWPPTWRSRDEPQKYSV